MTEIKPLGFVMDICLLYRLCFGLLFQNIFLYAIVQNFSISQRLVVDILRYEFNAYRVIIKR